MSHGFSGHGLLGGARDRVFRAQGIVVPVGVAEAVGSGQHVPETQEQVEE